MSTLTIDKSTAQKVYADADPAGKNILKSLFGEETFTNAITDRVKSYSDACSVLGIVCFAPTGSADEIAYKQLKTIVQALNEGWTPDWDDDDEYKYYPFWNMRNGFSLSNVDCDCGCSDVGSRLCFKSEELAQYAAAQFFDLYKAFHTI